MLSHALRYDLVATLRREQVDRALRAARPELAPPTPRRRWRLTRRPLQLAGPRPRTP